jgi:hypothetical protein
VIELAGEPAGVGQGWPDASIQFLDPQIHRDEAEPSVQANRGAHESAIDLDYM